MSFSSFRCDMVLSFELLIMLNGFFQECFIFVVREERKLWFLLQFLSIFMKDVLAVFSHSTPGKVYKN